MGVFTLETNKHFKVSSMISIFSFYYLSGGHFRAVEVYIKIFLSEQHTPHRKNMHFSNAVIPRNVNMNNYSFPYHVNRYIY